MTVRLKESATIFLASGDVHRLLSDALCVPCSAFEKLRVTGLEQTYPAENGFAVTLSPLPPASAPKGPGQ